MKPKDFHFALIEIINSIEGFLKTFWTMLIVPQTGFAKALNAKTTPKILPGVFLFLNLAISNLLGGIPSPALDDIHEWSLQALKEVPSHLIGTLLFLFLLKLSFWKAKTTKLFTIICLSSIVYIPYAVVMWIIGLIVATPFLNFIIFAFSGDQTIAELFAPVITTCFKLLPLLSILTAVLIWWCWLLSVGCGHISSLPTAKRVLRLSLSISAYIIIFIAALVVVLGSITFSMLRGYGSYEKMRISFKNENYAEALVLASRVSNNEKLVPVARYRAYLIGSISHFKTFRKNDDAFRDAIVAINTEKYRDAEMIMRREIRSLLLLRNSPMLLRLALRNVETALGNAAKQYDSPLYSEDKTQQISLLVFFRDIPMNLFPSL